MHCFSYRHEWYLKSRGLSRREWFYDFCLADDKTRWKVLLPFIEAETRGISKDQNITVTRRLAWISKEPLSDHPEDPRTVPAHFAQTRTAFFIKMLLLCLKKFTVLCVKQSDTRLWKDISWGCGNNKVLYTFQHANPLFPVSQTNLLLACPLNYSFFRLSWLTTKRVGSDRIQIPRRKTE